VQLTACAAAGQAPAAAHEYVRVTPPAPPPTAVVTQQISGAAQLQPVGAAASPAADDDEVPLVAPVVLLVVEVADFPVEPPLLLLVLDPPHATASDTAIDTANMERNAFSFIASSFPNACFAHAQRQRTCFPKADDLRAPREVP
jgi:hypothetical protein